MGLMNIILGSAKAHEKGKFLTIRIQMWRVRVTLSIDIAKRKKNSRR